MEDRKMSNPFSKEQLLFSIISPCWGKDYKHLRRNAEVLNEQEYKEFEWIVVLQKPDKELKKAVKEMEKIKKEFTFPISYYVIEEKGACQARNFGATKAKGDIYAFVNADCFLYTEALRMWANVFETKPHINRVWGLYDIITENGMNVPVGQVPIYPNGKVWYKAFKYQNYCDSCFPIRKSAYIPWDTTVKSLQDWDWAIRQLQRDNFEGKDWEYIHHSFFAAQDALPGGLSHDSHTHWIERTDYIRNKNGIPKSDICVCSLGAAHHGFHVAEKLGADYLPMPSFKDHKYKMIYLLGFYTKENPKQPYVTKAHMDVFERNKGKSVIHWIGTDILNLRWNCNFEKIKAIKKWIKEKKIINLSEADFTKKELKEVGIETKVIPIPPKRLYETMSLPKEFTVGIYEAPNTDLYNPEFMQTIVRSMPDVKFLFFGDETKKGIIDGNQEHVGYIPSEEVIKRCSCNLRITVHDGLPMLPIEFLTAGRQVITNVPLKGSIQVQKDRRQVVEAIRKARREKLDSKVSKYWRKELDFKKYAKRIRGLM